MAEYYVHPNVNYSPAASNVAPASVAAANAWPAAAASAYGKGPYGPAQPVAGLACARPLSAEAVLVLFILLVIITRLFKY